MNRCEVALTTKYCYMETEVVKYDIGDGSVKSLLNKPQCMVTQNLEME